MRDSLNRVYVVQYSELLSKVIELGGIHYNIETAIDEVDKNGYEYMESGDIGYGQFMRYYREEGEHYPSGYAEIVEREIIDRFEDVY